MNRDRVVTNGKGYRYAARALTARSGAMLVELMVAFAILTVSLSGIMLVMSSSHSLMRTNEDTLRASQAALRALENVKGEVFAEAFARFNATVMDDPALGSSPGANFAIRGLEAIDGDLDGLAGEITFPGDGVTLREDIVDRDLGMPRDLNGDGTEDALDHSLDYIVLPVRVRVRWQGVDGERSQTFVTILSEN